MPLLSNRNVKILSILGAFAALIFIYLHHFHNTFQNDDPYFIQDNTAIRSLKNIPSFFTDPHTESSLPKFQAQYRPLFTLSLAIDYYIANGISPVVMHLHTFIGFLVLIVLCFLLFRKIFRHITPTPFYPALLATCIFALHPVTADVVNYLTARSNIFGTLYGMLYVIMWLYAPSYRKYYLYLIPLIIGCLFKIIAVMFIPALWLYIILFEYDARLDRGVYSAFKSSLKVMLPALLTGFIVYVFMVYKSIPGDDAAKVIAVDGALSVKTTILTQVHVVMRYFMLFFIPENINPYGRHPFITTPFNYNFISGALFILTSFLLIYLLSLRKSTRIISFGLAWFFLFLVPTSSFIPFPVNYVEYYMFSSLIGLSLALAATIYLIANYLKQESRYVFSAIIAGCLIFLATLTYGSYERVKVWSSDKAMLEDVISKDPTNWPTLMNLGVYYMEKGKFDTARILFNETELYNPNYDLVYLNMGILCNATHDTVGANTNFKKALDLHGLFHYQACYYYGSFLHSMHRDTEAIKQLTISLNEMPSFTPASDLLNDIKKTTQNTDAEVMEKAIMEKSHPSENEYINLSLSYFNAGDYEKCITICKKIIALDSNSAIAYNNICACYNKLQQWDNAIKAGNKALQIKPDFILARNNLSFAISQKRK